ncbi:SLATT domain-containing protein [Bacillus cereus group sp. Bc065]|uniref:SLATT domain-containing protein n=1 Tax=Bacillus cereus group sp. Bc065 TaxID=3018115 RepID=UPI0022E01FEA|nr:SLATT domain-containing protein [Bacillus cereus group sp. Bc065]MDA2593843.1 SLATT domain-containing protein [Bacillus cereus group sp. Bc065]
MNKDALLKELATNGYNVGFGAKKHFATYDIVEKIPVIISVITFMVGLGQLAYPNAPYAQFISLILVIISAFAFYISPYSQDKEKYEEAGVKTTKLFNKLRALYWKVQISSADNFQEEETQMREIMNEFYAVSMSKQIYGSDWFAHYKFFCQMQIDWIDEQKKFKWYKDKIPKSLVFSILMYIVIFLLLKVAFTGGL